MAFKLENFGTEVANAKGTLGGVCYYRYFNEDDNTITTAGYFPTILGLSVGDRIWVIPSSVSDTDELYVVSSVSGGVVTVAKATSAEATAISELQSKLPDAPETDGAYVLTVTVADGAATYSWESAGE